MQESKNKGPSKAWRFFNSTPVALIVLIVGGFLIVMLMSGGLELLGGGQLKQENRTVSAFMEEYENPCAYILEEGHDPAGLREDYENGEIDAEDILHCYEQMYEMVEAEAERWDRTLEKRSRNG